MKDSGLIQVDDSAIYRVLGQSENKKKLRDLSCNIEETTIEAYELPSPYLNPDDGELAAEHGGDESMAQRGDLRKLRNSRCRAEMNTRKKSATLTTVRGIDADTQTQAELDRGRRTRMNVSRDEEDEPAGDTKAISS
ncbi:hypothetical protein F2Q70_00004714 [Brassica cretica]|uniref:Uncharacterized protein n=1 Tax=Brassica cretica TaxID=69181 RepID=A0A8S9IMY4_BRACR|nr:hypothetical protein F2Q68_00021544 [Brassica cretica]KAF2571510.1 hypothetical protein F2Q70_00004714 [Brassica cretica]